MGWACRGVKPCMQELQGKLTSCEMSEGLSATCRNGYGTREGGNVVLNPVPSHYPHLLLPEKTLVSLLSFNYLRVTNDKKICELTLKQKNTSSCEK